MANTKYDGAAVVAKAKTYQGKFTYEYGARGPLKIDCSGFIIRIYNELYPALVTKIGVATSVMVTYANGHGGIRKDKPLIGDLALWEGHVEFVSAVNGTSFSTFGASSNKKNSGITPSEKSFSGTSDPSLKWYGSTKTFLGFFTPVL